MSSAVVAVAVAVLLGGAPPPSRTLVAGPALAGDRVVWGERRGQTNVVVGAGSGALLWQSRSAWLDGPRGVALDRRLRDRLQRLLRRKYRLPGRDNLLRR